MSYAKPYYVDGARVPSVTTVISRFKESGGLIHWAWKLGTEGQDYRQVRDAAAATGTQAHKLVEQWIRGKKVALDKAELQARNAFNQFRRWQLSTNLLPTKTEVRLTSEKHRFGGTLDAMLVNDKLSLGDWKTSNSVYPDYLLQIAAYGILWEENFPEHQITGGYHLLRFSKDNSDFAHYHFGELETEKKAFLLMVELYYFMEVIKRRI